MVKKCEWCNSFAKYNASGVWCCGKHLAKQVDELLLTNECVVVE